MAVLCSDGMHHCNCYVTSAASAVCGCRGTYILGIIVVHDVLLIIETASLKNEFDIFSAVLAVVTVV